ncbi:MAG: hypothetical protein HKN01_09280 [Acidimicrobiia bacterium]|nr:hypothetical protein [Acidimicrobiia bacterium]NNK91771.1 hypothetical protein [Acidimicrobiia bacterium]
MIIPLPDRRLLIAHRSELVIHDIESGDQRVVDVGGGSMIRFALGEDGYFAVKHYSFAEPPVRLITAHHIDAPGVVTSTMEIGEDFSVTASGDTGAWDHLPSLYTLVFPYLLRLTADGAQILRLPGIPGLPEEPDDPYRLVACPGNQHAIVTPSRTGGRFVVYDLDTATVAADLNLGRGAPTFRFHDDTVLLSHTDTVFRIDRSSWEPQGGFRFRNTIKGGLISDIAISPDGARIAVAYSDSKPIPLMLPYRIAPVAGSVLVVDAATDTVTHGGGLGRWADEVAFIDDDTVAAREQGGDLNIEIADLEPIEWDLYPPRGPGEEWM